MKKEEEALLLWRRRGKLHFYEEGEEASLLRRGRGKLHFYEEGEEAWSMAMELCCLQEEEQGRGALQEK